MFRAPQEILYIKYWVFVTVLLFLLFTSKNLPQHCIKDKVVHVFRKWLKAKLLFWAFYWFHAILRLGCSVNCESSVLFLFITHFSFLFCFKKCFINKACLLDGKLRAEMEEIFFHILLWVRLLHGTEIPLTSSIVWSVELIPPPHP